MSFTEPSRILRRGRGSPAKEVAPEKAAGLEPKGRRAYELADGTEITVDVTTADIEFMGEIVGGTILFGEPDAEPLLGVTALESAGVEVDPVNQRLKRLPSIPLKALAA